MTFRLKLAAMIAVTGVAWSSGSAHAWHEKGHMMVAAVAWEQMTPAVRARAIQLLKINKDYNKWIAGVADDMKDKTAFMRASVWPDDIKNKTTHPGFVDDGDTPPKTKQAGQNIGYADKRMHKYWHYKDVPFSPDGTKTFPAPSVNAETQIRRFTAAISKPGVSDNIKSYDIVWLIHMVGDVHQPLHATARFTKAFKTSEGDRGGNSVRIDCCGSKLHTYWDGGVVGDSSDPKVAADAAGCTAGRSGGRGRHLGSGRLDPRELQHRQDRRVHEAADRDQRCRVEADTGLQEQCRRGRARTHRARGRTARAAVQRQSEVRRRLLPPVHLRVNAVLDLVEQRAPLRLPAERARPLAAHAAVRAEAQICAGSHPLDRFADRPVLRLVAHPEHAAERLRDRFEVRFAVLGVEQRAGCAFSSASR